MEAVSNDGRALQYASENLRRDNFVVMEALPLGYETDMEG